MNPGSISFKKHEMDILEFSIQLKDLEQFSSLFYLQLKESLPAHPPMGGEEGSRRGRGGGRGGQEQGQAGMRAGSIGLSRAL